MTDDFLTRLTKISSEAAKGVPVEVSANGEDYYTFTVTGANGAKSNLPAIWLAPGSTDQQIRDKFSREYLLAFNPGAGDDDLSIPNLQTEGKQR